MFMDKKLKAYIKEAEELAKKPSKEKRDYHLMMLETFKHERVVHLFVTLAFALYMIVMFLAFLFFSINYPEGKALNFCLGFVTLALTVTVVLYARHYYLLENGCQKLEEISKKFYDIKD